MSYPRPSTNPAAFGPAADVSPSPRFPEIERDVLDFWARDDTFRASIAQRDGAEEWVFYDGPPFANGLPHYGHLLTGYAKDLFPRFQTMRGKKVDRVFGWDTHGLPAELEAMKQLGITEKSEIEQMGIASFNAKARESVLEYTQQWEDYVTRQARWVDFERGYKTLDTGYMESVLWAFKSCGTRASPTRAPRAAVLLARRDPFVEPRAAHGRRRLQDAAGPLGHRHVPARRREGGEPGAHRCPRPRVDDHALDAADQPRSRGRPRHRVRRRAGRAERRGGCPGIRRRRGAAAHRYLLASDLLGGYAKDLGYENAAEAAEAVERTILGASSRTCITTGSSTTTRMPRCGAPSAWRILVDDYVTRPTAPASCTRRRRSVRTTSGSPRRPASRSS
jgi:isoleucyl-tRNA synthetase